MAIFADNEITELKQLARVGPKDLVFGDPVPGGRRGFAKAAVDKHRELHGKTARPADAGEASERAEGDGGTLWPGACFWSQSCCALLQVGLAVAAQVLEERCRRRWFPLCA